jgi:hypothetical protein
MRAIKGSLGMSRRRALASLAGVAFVGPSPSRANAQTTLFSAVQLDVPRTSDITAIVFLPSNADKSSIKINLKQFSGSFQWNDVAVGSAVDQARFKSQEFQQDPGGHLKVVHQYQNGSQDERKIQIWVSYTTK